MCPCGQELDGSAQFCSACGRLTATGSEAQLPRLAPKGRTRLWTIALVSCTTVGALVVGFALLLRSPSTADEYSNILDHVEQIFDLQADLDDQLKDYDSRRLRSLEALNEDFQRFAYDSEYQEELYRDDVAKWDEINASELDLVAGFEDEMTAVRQSLQLVPVKSESMTDLKVTVISFISSEVENRRKYVETDQAAEGSIALVTFFANRRTGLLDNAQELATGRMDAALAIRKQQDEAVADLCEILAGRVPSDTDLVLRAERLCFNS